MDINRFLRPRVLAIIFGTYFLIIALAAAIFVSGLKGVWYRADLSRWVYVGYLVTAAVFLSGTSAAAAIGARRARAEQTGAEVLGDRAEAGSPSAGQVQEAPAPSPAQPGKDSVDRDIDELLVSLQEMETQAEEAESPGPPSAAEETQKEAAPAGALKKARPAAAMFMLGPAIASAVIVGLCAALLPGVEVMLQSYHQLNTGVILGIAYSYGGLAAYTALSTFAMLRSE